MKRPKLKSPMTIEYVMRVVDYIESVSDDAESAHSVEDSLYEEVLMEIAAGCKPRLAAELAKQALKTKGVKFSRWYA